MTVPSMSCASLGSRSTIERNCSRTWYAWSASPSEFKSTALVIMSETRASGDRSGAARSRSVSVEAALSRATAGGADLRQRSFGPPLFDRAGQASETHRVGHVQARSKSSIFCVSLCWRFRSGQGRRRDNRLARTSSAERPEYLERTEHDRQHNHDRRDRQQQLELRPARATRFHRNASSRRRSSRPSAARKPRLMRSKPERAGSFHGTAR